MSKAKKKHVEKLHKKVTGIPQSNELIQAGRRVGKNTNTTVAMSHKLANDLELSGEERIAFLQSATAAFGFFSEIAIEG